MGTVLSSLMRTSGSLQWLCKVLEGLLGQKHLQPDDVVRAVELEKAAAAKIEMLGVSLCLSHGSSLLVGSSMCSW